MKNTIQEVHNECTECEIYIRKVNRKEHGYVTTTRKYEKIGIDLMNIESNNMF